jgi:hypothetical protein
VSEVADLAAALVRIDSVNPSLIAGAAGEAEIADFVAPGSGVPGSTSTSSSVPRGARP